MALRGEERARLEVEGKKSAWKSPGRDGRVRGVRVFTLVGTLPWQEFFAVRIQNFAVRKLSAVRIRGFAVRAVFAGSLKAFAVRHIPVPCGIARQRFFFNPIYIYLLVTAI